MNFILRVGRTWDTQIAAIRDAVTEDTNLIRYDNTFYRICSTALPPAFTISVLPSTGGVPLVLNMRTRDLYVELIGGHPFEKRPEKKLNPLRAILKGKRIVIIDDSIVRGTTTNKLVKLLKGAGAKEVHVRITCPPIISPCFYGVDISSHSELIAFRCNGNVEEIRKILGADSLGYQTIDGLAKAIGIGKENLCMACLNEDYPTPGAAKIAKEMKKRSGEEIKEKKRYWEM
jgi:hypothetical protein